MLTVAHLKNLSGVLCFLPWGLLGCCQNLSKLYKSAEAQSKGPRGQPSTSWERELLREEVSGGLPTHLSEVRQHGASVSPSGHLDDEHIFVLPPKSFYISFLLCEITFQISACTKASSQVLLLGNPIHDIIPEIRPKRLAVVQGSVSFVVPASFPTTLPDTSCLLATLASRVEILIITNINVLF